jgi:GntR family transcriptional regulator
VPTFITVDPRNGVPVYRQVIDQIKRAVAVGVLAGGEQLPTVKALALQLTVNANTVARAYRDLERDGVIQTAVGRGSFVRESNLEKTRSLDDIARATFDDAVREVKALGVTREDAHTLAHEAITRWYPEERA